METTKRHTLTKKYYTHELKGKLLTRLYWKGTFNVTETFSIKNGKEKLIRTTVQEEDIKLLQKEEFPLKKINKMEIPNWRRSKKPFFLLKENGVYYITGIPQNLNLLGEKHICKHLCSSCANAYPSTCQKVLDRGDKKIIENYSFIPQGFETSSTRIELFIVNECSRYKKSI